MREHSQNNSTTTFGVDTLITAMLFHQTNYLIQLKAKHLWKKKIQSQFYSIELNSEKGCF